MNTNQLWSAWINKPRRQAGTAYLVAGFKVTYCVCHNWFNNITGILTSTLSGFTDIGTG